MTSPIRDPATQLASLVSALRAWTKDPSNHAWKPVQKILEEIGEQERGQDEEALPDMHV